MNHINHNAEDLVGIVSGIVGYIISKIVIGFNLMGFVFVIPWLPKLTELLHSGITAFVCAAVGFFTTRLLHYIFKRKKS